MRSDTAKALEDQESAKKLNKAEQQSKDLSLKKSNRGQTYFPLIRIYEVEIFEAAFRSMVLPSENARVD
jgi:hypothetical protein